MNENYEKLLLKAEKLQIGTIQRHIFLCSDQTNPKCSTKEAGLESWDYLRKRIDELGLGAAGVYRTKANCLRMCVYGPVAVVHPDNVWYHSCKPEVLEQIIQGHLIGGVPVEEYRIPASASPSTAEITSDSVA